MTTANTRPRVQDWPTLLFHFIEMRRDTPFEWGRQDCCLFACGAILAQTGMDVAAPDFRGRYSDALGAARVVALHGGVEAIAERVTAAHGWPELATPLLAQRGDVALMDVPDAMRSALGVVIGPRAMFPGADGLIEFPLKDCRRAWAIARPCLPAHLKTS